MEGSAADSVRSPSVVIGAPLVTVRFRPACNVRG